MGHSLLLAHAFKLGLNYSPFCTLRLNTYNCDLPYILFNYPPLLNKRLVLLNFLKSFDIPINFSSTLNINCDLYCDNINIYIYNTYIVIIFILEAGFIL